MRHRRVVAAANAILVAVALRANGGEIGAMQMAGRIPGLDVDMRIMASRAVRRLIVAGRQCLGVHAAAVGLDNIIVTAVAVLNVALPDDFHCAFTP